MLKLDGKHAQVQLSGQRVLRTDGLFWLAAALLIAAVAVAAAMSLLSERLAIAALALLVVGSFIFNKLRHSTTHARQVQHINHGTLWVSKGELVHDTPSKRTALTDINELRIQQQPDELQLYNAAGQLTHRITGFDNPKEMQVVVVLWHGQALTTRHANIKMQSSQQSSQT